MIVCLTDYAAWQAIIEDNELGACFNETCIIQLTTGTLDAVEEHAAFITSHGGRIADGAVMCYPRDLGTESGSLLMSGSAAVLEECDPILRMLAPNWTNLGEDVRKPAILSRALMVDVAMSLIGIVNGAEIARAGDIPLDLFMQHTRNVGAILPAEKIRLIEAIRDGNTRETQASISAWGEGQRAVRSIAQSLQVNLVLHDAVQQVFEQAEERGLAGHDLAAISEIFAPEPRR